MSKWEFFELDHNGETIPLDNLKIIPWIEQALNEAAESKVPDSKFSQYYVNCSCLVIDKISGSAYSCKTRIMGGNVEYGLCQALHGEESLIIALRSNMGSIPEDLNRFTVLIAFCSKFENGRVPTCCGNCRDIMRDMLPLDTMIFGGHPNGGRVIVARLHNLLGDEYHKSPVVFREGFYSNSEVKQHLGDISFVESILTNCIKLENNIYFPGQPNPERRYYAIIGNPGHNYFGAHDVMCDYHPIYAIRDAVRQVRRHSHIVCNGLLFNYALVASEYYLPDVMYKDRQHLLELNFQQECISGRVVNPPVYLASYELVNNNPRITTIFQTSVKEWLPFAFSPANFGVEFVRNAEKKFRS